MGLILYVCTNLPSNNCILFQSRKSKSKKRKAAESEEEEDAYEPEEEEYVKPKSNKKKKVNTILEINLLFNWYMPASGFRTGLGIWS